MSDQISMRSFATRPPYPDSAPRAGRRGSMQRAAGEPLAVGLVPDQPVAQRLGRRVLVVVRVDRRGLVLELADPLVDRLAHERFGARDRAGRIVDEPALDGGPWITGGDRGGALGA